MKKKKLKPWYKLLTKNQRKHLCWVFEHGTPSLKRFKESRAQQKKQQEKYKGTELCFDCAEIETRLWDRLYKQKKKTNEKRSQNRISQEAFKKNPK